MVHSCRILTYIILGIALVHDIKHDSATALYSCEMMCFLPVSPKIQS